MTYSWRRAFIGSTREARYAGIKAAVTNRRPKVVPIDSGSAALVSYSRLRTTCMDASEAERPGRGAPYPDGAIILAQHWTMGSSPKNDKVLTLLPIVAGAGSRVSQFKRAQGPSVAMYCATFILLTVRSLVSGGAESYDCERFQWRAQVARLRQRNFDLSSPIIKAHVMLARDGYRS